MNKNNIKILAIETSCDETAAAVIGVENDQPIILSNVVSSQADLHAKTGGVVPEVASRAHMEAMIPVVSEALVQASQIVISSPEGDPLGRAEKSSNKRSLHSGRDDKYFIPSNNLSIEQYNDAIVFLKDEIDYIAVTVGPGLIGSLLVGFNAAKTLAYTLDKPIIPINHIEGHIYSAFVEQVKSKRSKVKSASEHSVLGYDINCEEFPISNFQFPIIALTVSGGHTSLTLMKGHGQYENIGQTIDDAAGEAFDKVAKLLDLGYPGGPIVSKLANQYRKNSKFKMQNLKLNENYKSKIENSMQGIVFPRPILNDGSYNFSFSGLKTAVRQKVLELKLKKFNEQHPERVMRAEGSKIPAFAGMTEIEEVELSIEQKQEICAAFEDATVDVLVTKSLRAAEQFKPNIVILAGGVAANSHLRETFKRKFEEKNIPVVIPPLKFTGDNAAMIGIAALYHIKRNNLASWRDLKIDSNLEL